MRLGWLMVSCCLGLSACSNLDPRLNPSGALFAARMTRLTETYNQRYGTHYPVPHLSVDDMPAAQASVVGAAEYSAWTVHINRLWVLKDPCTVDREALAHELAHLFVYYDKYGPPRNALLNTSKGMQLVAMNGPGLQDSTVEHGAEWQAKARALGADPCREGYCYTAKPYKKYPLSCPSTQTALAIVR